MAEKRIWKLWLDDVRDPPDLSWKVARSVEDAIHFVEGMGLPTFMSLDYDMDYKADLLPSGMYSGQQTGGIVPNGYDFLKWLFLKMFTEGAEEHPHVPPPPPPWNIHSANKGGADKMRRLLDAWEKTADRGKGPN